MNSHELPKEHGLFCFFLTLGLWHIFCSQASIHGGLHFLALTKPFSLISSTDEHRSHGEMKEETD